MLSTFIFTSIVNILSFVLLPNISSFKWYVYLQLYLNLKNYAKVFKKTFNNNIWELS